MKKNTKIFILIVVICVALVTALDIQTKGKITSLIGSVNPMNLKVTIIPYTNDTSVYRALNTLYTKLNSMPYGKNNTVYFEYDEPTTSSTTDYTTLNKTVFVALNNQQKSLCIIRNSRLHCFDNNNWIVEKDHLKSVFSDITCETITVGNTSSLECTATDFYCSFSSGGQVYCSDRVHNKNACQIYSDNVVRCY